jgi:hypothetical protein
MIDPKLAKEVHPISDKEFLIELIKGIRSEIALQDRSTIVQGMELVKLQKLIHRDFETEFL